MTAFRKALYSQKIKYKILRGTLVFVLIFSWLFSGTPQIFFPAPGGETIAFPEKPKKAYAGEIAAGIIVGWPEKNGNIPTGWTRETALDGKYIIGTSTDAGTGATGGANTSSHETSSTHTHTQPTSHRHLGAGVDTDAIGDLIDSGSGSGASSAASGHAVVEPDSVTDQTTGTEATGSVNPDGTTSDSHEPLHQEIIWIRNTDGATPIPDGAIAFLANSTLPTNWVATSSGLMYKGAATAADSNLTTQGSSDHTHTMPHDHSQQETAHPDKESSTPQQSNVAWGNGGAAIARDTHTHTLSYGTGSHDTGASNGNIDSSSNLPPVVGLVAIQNETGANESPSGVIALWTGNIGDIPTDWKLCEDSGADCDIDIANSGTDRGRFVQATTTALWGNTWGEETHTHTSSGHTHTTNHTHTVTYAATSGGKQPSGTGITSAGNTHTHITSVTTLSPDYLTDAASISLSASNSLLEYVGVAFIQYNPPPDTTVSGTLYSDEGTTQITSGKTIKIAVGTSSPPTVYSTTTDSGAGTWSIVLPVGHALGAGVPISAWVDNGSGTYAFAQTKASGPWSITGLDLYQDRVIVRHDATQGTSTLLADLDFYDADNDTDIQYKVTGTTLEVNAGQELHIWAGSEFAPEGNVILHGNAGAGVDGDLHLAESATSSILTLGGNLTLAGSYFASSTAIFTPGGGIVTFNASTTGKDIFASATPFVNLVFNEDASSGGWTFQEQASTTDLTITAGNVTAPTLFSITGDYSNSDTFTAGSGTVLLDGTAQQTLSGNMTESGGTVNAFNNLTILNTVGEGGGGSPAQSIIFANSASTTGTFSMVASTSAQFPAGATSTFQNINFTGATDQYVWLRSSSDGSEWGFDVPGTQTAVAYVDVRDSNACSGNPDIIADGETNIDSTGNPCWDFTLISPFLNQRAYVFRNDDGAGGVGLASTIAQEATSTPRTDVIQGERMIIAFQLDNIGGATSSIPLRLQYDKDDNVWVDVATSTEIRYSLSMTGAKTSSNRFYQPIATSTGATVDNTCQAGGNFAGGRLYSNVPASTTPAGLASSTPLYAIDIGAGDCAEVAFAIHTGSSTLGTTYNLRLVQATTTVDHLLDNYITYPKITIESARNIRFSKQSFGTTTSLVAKMSSNDIGTYNSLAIGTDGYPVIASQNSNITDRIIVTKCLDTSCSSYTNEVVTYSSNDIGDFTSLAIGTDGYPVIASQAITSPRQIIVTKCADASCSSYTNEVVTYSSNSIGYDISLAIGTDGYPVIASRDWTAIPTQIIVTKCADISCSSYTNEVVTYPSNDIGWFNSLAIGTDGYPVIASQGTAGTDHIIVTKCSDASCSSYTNEVVTYSSNNIGQYASLAIGTDGYPVIASQDTTTNPDTIIVTKCADASCSSYTNSVVTYPSNSIGTYNSLAIGTDGYPVIASRDTTASPTQIIIIKCADASCSSYTNSPVNHSPSIGTYNSLAIGTDGYPVIASRDTTTAPKQIVITKCNSFDCSGAETSSNANIPSDVASDLDFYLDKVGYANVTSSDDIYDSLSAASSTIAYQFVTASSSNTDAITAEWEGQVSGESQDITLQIFRFGTTNAWETVAASTSPMVDVDTYLSSKINTNISDYYNSVPGGIYEVYTRVTMATTTNVGTLRTDSASTTFTIIAPTLTQRAYVFRNDDGAGGGGLASTTPQEATSTPRTNVIQGERIIVAFQLDNTGDAISSIPLGLQFDKNDGIWLDVGSTTEIRYSSSLTGAKTSRNNFWQPIATSTGAIVDNSCASSGSFLGGRFVSGQSSTTPINIGINDCAELAFAIHTGSSTLGQIYNFRLVHATTSATLDAYTQTPTITIESARNIRFSKGAVGGVGVLTLDTGGADTTGFFTSLAIGTDGFPVISYRNVTNGSLEFAKCHDIACASVTISTLNNVANTGEWSSIAIGTDGFPVISYLEIGNSRLEIAKCGDPACISIATSTLDNIASVGKYTSIAIGTDGFPVVSYQNITGTDSLRFAKCHDIACASVTASTLDSGDGNNVGYYTSIAIGTDGFPVIVYQDATDGDLEFAKCADIACVSVATSTLDFGASFTGDQPAIAIGTDGFPVISYFDTTSDEFKLAKCNDVSCTSPTINILEVNGETNRISSENEIAIGADGFPIVSYYDDIDNRLKLAKCNDVACISVATSTLDSRGDSNDVGHYNSIAIGADGFPVVSYYDGSSKGLKFLKCNNLSCIVDVAEDSAANLPTDVSSDLDFYLDKVGYTAATSSDNIYDSMSAASSTIAFQFVTAHSNNTDQFTPEWEGQVSDESQDLTLEVFRFGATNAWENVATQASPTVDFDYYLASQITTNLSDYYNGAPGGIYEVYTRVTMATTTGVGTLRTDSASTTFAGTPTLVLTISGTLYSDEGVTEDTGGSDVIHVRVATSTPGVFSTTTDSGSGEWKIDTILKTDMDPGVSIVVWVDNDSAKRASVFTKANHTSDDITGLDLYKDRVIVRHEATQGTSTLLADLDFYDADNDTDIQYKVTGTTLEVNAGQELHIWAGSEFAPEGNVILHGNAGAGVDGDLHLARSATSSILTLGGNLTIAGSYFASSTTIFTPGSNTTTFNASTTGKNIFASTTPLGNVVFNEDASSGGWTLQQSASTTDLTITAGTVTVPTLLSIAGDYSNAGTFTHNSGTTYFTGSSKTYSGTMTDTSTFNDVVLTGSGLKTFSAQASTSAFTIENNAQFAGNQLFSVSGNYTNNATFSHTGTMLFDGASAQTLSGTMDTTTTDFGVIEFLGAGAKTFNANASTTNFTIDSTAGEVTAPSDRLSISGNYTNNGTFNANNGTVTLNGTASQTLSGTLISDGTNNSAFYNIEITNNTSEATTTFSSVASTTNNFTVTALGARVEFTAGATSTLVNLIITGSSGNEIYLHSATENTQWNIHSTGTRAVTYANIKDSNACSSAGDIEVFDGTSIDEGNNDCWNFTVPSPTLTQRAYIFRNDDGAGGGGLASTTIQEATSTPRTSVIQGERMIVAFQLDNTGTATSSIPLRIQYDKNDSNWSDIGTTTEIRYSSSLTGAKTSRNNFWQPIATSTGAIVNNECFSSGSFIGGRFVSGQSSTTPMDIGANDCAELAFALHTGSSTLGQIYNFRLVHATTSAILDAYTQTPTITIEAARNIRFSKQSFGTTTSLAIPYSTDSLGWYNSLAIGTDGYPVIASQDGTANPDQIIITKCADASCSSYTNEVVTYSSNDIGYDNSLAIGTDGYPVIASRDITASPDQIIVTKCADISCSSYTNEVVTYSSNDIGYDNSLAIGTDGYPVIASRDITASPDQIIVTKCADISCSSYTNEVVTYSSNNIGGYNSLAIGTDGYPVIASQDTSANPRQVIVTKCADISCSSYTNEVVTYSSNWIGDYVSLAIGTDGYPVIASQDTSANPFQIIVTKCADISCSSYTNEVVTYSTDYIGYDNSLAIGTDGYPVIASRDGDGTDKIIVTKCADISCSSYTNSPVTYSSNIIGKYNSLAIGTDGYPVIASKDTSANPDQIIIIKCNSFDCSGAETSANANIPSDVATDLDFYLDKAGYTAATSSDDIYDSHSAASSTIAYQFVSLHSNNTDDITPEWEGQVSNESQDITLDIYRFGATNAWENVASQASPSVDTDYYLASQITENLSDYYNGEPGGNYEIYTRVTMATTTGVGTLRTDSASTTFSVSVGAAAILSTADQIFQLGQSQTAISPITITETAEGGSITNANELRIAIATSSVDMLWYSSDTEASFTGTASGRVDNTVAYEGGDSVLVITVNSDFQANETLIISGLSFATFGTVNAPTPGLTTFLDGASDTSANSTDSKDIAIKGTMAASDHDAGVESNAFSQSATSVTNGELIGFKLTPTGEEFTIHKVQFKLSGINGITIGDFTNAKLYIDYGADGNVTTGDEQFGGPGTVVFRDASRGYITFNADFNATTTRNYIIRADITNISPGNAFVIGITEGGITSTGNTSLASTTVPITLSGRQHIRVHRGSVPIGGAAPEGAGEQSGGGAQSGGEVGGPIVGYGSPNATGIDLTGPGNANQWTDGYQASTTDDLFASETTHAESQDYGNFSFSIPADNQIDGIEVKIEAHFEGGGHASTTVSLSWDGGTTYTSTKTTGDLTGNDVLYTLGANGVLWGRGSWTIDQLNNTNFRLRVTSDISGGATLYLDHIQVHIYHVATGGGSGGGGEVRGPVNRLFANALEASKSFFAFFSSFFF